MILPNVFNVSYHQKYLTLLYNAIHSNGYEFIYISARGLSFSSRTKKYLLSVCDNDVDPEWCDHLGVRMEGEQKNSLHLPLGPLLLSPSSIKDALHAEVVAKRPDVYKVVCVRDIMDLFEDGEYGRLCGYVYVYYYIFFLNNWSGIGNRDTDILSYLASHIPLGKILMMDPQGCVSVVNIKFKNILAALGLKEKVDEKKEKKRKKEEIKIKEKEIKIKEKEK
jgi:phosphatidate phosphatase LPIN